MIPIGPYKIKDGPTMIQIKKARLKPYSDPERELQFVFESTKGVSFTQLIRVSNEARFTDPPVVVFQLNGNFGEGSDYRNVTGIYHTGPKTGNVIVASV